MPAFKVSTLALALALFLGACHGNGNGPVQPAQKIDASTVGVSDMTHLRTTKIESKVFPLTVELPGRIVIPDKDIFSLSARVQGRLETVGYTVGDQVAAGVQVAMIWSPDLATASEELAIAKSQANDSLLALTRQKLLAMGLDPKDAVTRQAAYPLRTPIGGVVLERKLNAGAAVNPGDAILTIGKLGAYSFQGELPPDQAVRVKKGMKITFDEQPSIQAHVEAVSPVADPVSRLIKVRCRFDTPPPSTLPQETFLKAQVVTQEVSALVAPAKSLVLASDGEYVFVRQPGDRNVFRRVKIKVNSRNKNEIAVEPTAEVGPGSEIVSEGALLLNDLLDDSG